MASDSSNQANSKTESKPRKIFRPRESAPKSSENERAPATAANAPLDSIVEVIQLLAAELKELVAENAGNLAELTNCNERVAARLAVGTALGKGTSIIARAAESHQRIQEGNLRMEDLLLTLRMRRTQMGCETMGPLRRQPTVYKGDYAAPNPSTAEESGK